MSDDRSRIYAVDDGWHGPELQSVEVVRLTSKFVWTGRSGLAFGYRRRHERRKVHWTQSAAWDAFIDESERGIALLREQLVARERALGIAKRAAHRI